MKIKKITEILLVQRRGKVSWGGGAVPQIALIRTSEKVLRNFLGLG